MVIDCALCVRHNLWASHTQKRINCSHIYGSVFAQVQKLGNRSNTLCCAVYLRCSDIIIVTGLYIGGVLNVDKIELKCGHLNILVSSLFATEIRINSVFVFRPVCNYTQIVRKHNIRLRRYAAAAQYPSNMAAFNTMDRMASLSPRMFWRLAPCSHVGHWPHPPPRHRRRVTEQS